MNEAYQRMSETKAELQKTFRAMWNTAGRHGAAGAATGTGKTKPAIDEMMDLYRDATNWDAEVTTPPKFMVVVPTEQLRDVGWPKEVEQWYGEEGLKMWMSCVTCVCYVSLHLYRAADYLLVILDECHHLTQRSARFFQGTTLPVRDIPDVMALSATYPDPKREPEKYILLMSIAPLLFSYTLDQGVEDGIVRPFDIHIVLVPLDNVHKNVEVGGKNKRWMTTEANWYNTLTNSIKRAYAKGGGRAAEMLSLKRRSSLCNVPSKLKLAKAMITSLCTSGTRTLVFCGSIKQAEELLSPNVHHSKNKPRKGERSALERFQALEIETLGVVNTVNEGVNIPDLDQEIIVQMDSNPRTFTQRVGRAVRWRESHRAQIWILVSAGTVDNDWTQEAMRNFDKGTVSYHSHTEFLE